MRLRDGPVAYPFFGSVREVWKTLEPHAINARKLALYGRSRAHDDRWHSKTGDSMKRRQLLQAAASAAVALPGLGFAQSYPTKPIRYIVPVAAGGGNDMIARVVTERWGALL